MGFGNVTSPSSFVYSNQVYYATIGSGGIGSWTRTLDYPVNQSYTSCFVFGSNEYCVGGYNAIDNMPINSVYFSHLTSSGTGAWSPTNSYPENIMAEKCSLFSSSVYCVGGSTDGGNPVNSVYYAPVLANGIGAWASTNSYPLQVTDHSCAAENSYLYCFAGLTSIPGSSQINYGYSAPIISGGVGAWSLTAPFSFPTSAQSCTEYSGNVYCVGGAFNAGDANYAGVSQINGSSLGEWRAIQPYPIPVEQSSCVYYEGYIYCTGGYQNGLNNVNSSYYVATNSLLQNWVATTPYPEQTASSSCVSAAGYIYCVGGYNSSLTTNFTFYAPLSASGIGAWSQTTSYPISEYGAGCATTNSYIYCVGGFESSAGTGTQEVYYAPISSSGIGAWKGVLSNIYPDQSPIASCFIYNNNMYCTSSGSSQTESYYAPISVSGFGAWASTTPYDDSVLSGPACSQYAGIAYCLGGLNMNTGLSANQTYLASLGSNGIGSWTPGPPLKLSLEYTTSAISGPTSTTTISTTTTTVSTTSTTTIAPFALESYSDTGFLGGSTVLHSTISTSHSNDLLLVYVYQAGGLVSSISDAYGLDWQSTNSFGTDGVFYAVAPSSLLNDRINVHLSSGVFQYQMITLIISGANAISPFDPNPGLPSHDQNDVSTSNANDMLIYYLQVAHSVDVEQFPDGFTSINPQQIAYLAYNITSHTLSNAILPNSIISDIQYQEIDAIKKYS